MKDILRKSFGGIDRSYYIRNVFRAYFFMSLIMGLSVAMAPALARPTTLVMVLVFPLLYPYGRFVVDSVLETLFGTSSSTIVVLHPIWMVIMFGLKAMWFNMVLFLTPLIAPVGLTWLYFHHTAAERKGRSDDEV